MNQAGSPELPSQKAICPARFAQNFRALSGERPRVERISSRLLPLMRFDGLINLPLYGFEVEARRRLHGGILNRRLG